MESEARQFVFTWQRYIMVSVERGYLRYGREANGTACYRRHSKKGQVGPVQMARLSPDAGRRGLPGRNRERIRGDPGFRACAALVSINTGLRSPREAVATRELVCGAGRDRLRFVVAGLCDAGV